MKLTKGRATAAVAVMLLLGGAAGQGSSHREAPGITKTPKLDGTDFYMFRSYETGRSGFVTLVANYIPLQDPYGGPNYYTLDTDAVYEIHIDNNADANEDITFQFRPSILVKDLAVPAGNMMVFDESIDQYNSSNVSQNVIDPARLPRGRNASGQCVAMYPHNIIRTNTIFEVVDHDQLSGVVVLHFLQQHLAVADDVAERRAQLVASASQESGVAVDHTAACPSSASIFPSMRGSSMGFVS